MGVSGFVPREVARGPRTRKVCVGIKFEEENFPSLIQTGESASSNLAHPTCRLSPRIFFGPRRRAFGPDRAARRRPAWMQVAPQRCWLQGQSAADETARCLSLSLPRSRKG